MQHESWSQWMDDVCKCDVTSLPCAVQKTQFVHMHYFQCLSGLLSAKKEGDIILEPLKVGGCVLV